jgi:hypothetical protein
MRLCGIYKFEERKEENENNNNNNNLRDSKKNEIEVEPENSLILYSNTFNGRSFSSSPTPPFEVVSGLYSSLIEIIQSGEHGVVLGKQKRRRRRRGVEESTIIKNL